ncbi:lipopolysaccharide assembly protein LapB [Thalassotalea euphylliae]|uniref:lipopolysaccharide assembly protein LapB n=1 Tax=Thalassotalea euphylliae TaxID=1655234 RepID=UPI00363D6612
MLELLFLLLPVAMGYGWFMGRNSIKQKDQTAKQDLSIKYSTGLNYLLSNQQDKAIDYLIEALKVEDDTVEAHFALANLFRKRGELDRALKVHEHLVRHGNLPSKPQQQAVFELAKDFLTAGLYDRAEHMFHKLLKSKIYKEKSLTYLMQIYQSTKDWEQGVLLRKAIFKLNNKQLLHNLGNFYCELSVEAQQQDKFIDVIELLEQALICDPKSCRANWHLAGVYEEHEQYEQAAKCYEAIYRQDKDFFPEVIEKMHACYKHLGREDEFFSFIRQVYDETGGTSALIKYLEHLTEKHNIDKAVEFLLTALKRRPTIRGFKHFVKIQLGRKASDAEKESLTVIREMITEYINMRPRYSCRSCGFNSSTHYWSCPSCHDWETLKPVRGLEGE